MRFTIRHDFRYTYDSPVRLSTQYLRLMPRDTTRQKVLDWELETATTALRTTDGYGNVLHVLTIDKPASEIEIHARGSVETSASADGPSDFAGVPLSPLLFLRSTELTHPSPALAALAEQFRSRIGTAAGLRALAAAVHAVERGRSAADAAHSFIACCRHLGVPARYVSGYLYVVNSLARVAMHAWAEAWAEERWRSFDLAHDEPVGEAHIKIAVGADYLDACPVRGVRVGGGAESLEAQAHVEASQQ